MAINRACKHYERDKILKAFKHCVTVGICTFTEMMAFLISQYGKEIPKQFLSRSKLAIYSKRAKSLDIAVDDSTNVSEEVQND